MKVKAKRNWSESEREKFVEYCRVYKNGTIDGDTDCLVCDIVTSCQDCPLGDGERIDSPCMEQKRKSVEA